MVASAYKFVTWHTGIQKFIVQIGSTKKRKRSYSGDSNTLCPAAEPDVQKPKGGLFPNCKLNPT